MKINSKWVKDLNAGWKTIRLPEENIGTTFFDINISNMILSLSHKAKEIKAKISVQLKVFAHPKNPSMKQKPYLTFNVRKYFQVI